jgi:hypothetical protein
VYPYNPAKKLGKCRKFWNGPFKITTKLLDLNYEIISTNDKTQVIHVNRLKKVHDPEIWKPKDQKNFQKIRTDKKKNRLKDLETEKIQIGSRKPLETLTPEERFEPCSSPSRTTDTPQSERQATTRPQDERLDPNFEPSDTPRSRREMESTRLEPPLTPLRARINNYNILWGIFIH